RFIGRLRIGQLQGDVFGNSARGGKLLFTFCFPHHGLERSGGRRRQRSARPHLFIARRHRRSAQYSRRHCDDDVDLTIVLSRRGKESTKNRQTAEKRQSRASIRLNILGHTSQHHRAVVLHARGSGDSALGKGRRQRIGA